MRIYMNKVPYARRKGTRRKGTRSPRRSTPSTARLSGRKNRRKGTGSNWRGDVFIRYMASKAYQYKDSKKVAAVIDCHKEMSSSIFHWQPIKNIIISEHEEVLFLVLLCVSAQKNFQLGTSLKEEEVILWINLFLVKKKC